MSGPNVRKLIIRKMAIDAVPPGTTISLAEAVTFLGDPARMSASRAAAEDWVAAVLALVKSTPDNPHGDDDEAIAGVILAEVESKERSHA